ncbi:di-N-acetylchitobiase-like [Pteropus medius]|uniref:di-N-acetylchitobiase-like n=1 Tax=Pteropus vampyrus TaxID=132908 RepID=UPI00196AC469|nr:di-N-acetylchitobiase-like [Pteropus giganteus]
MLLWVVGMMVRILLFWQVFVFHVGGKTWKFYDWSRITTVVLFNNYDSELMCYAHSKGARVVLKGDVSLKKIIDPTFRASWIAQQVNVSKKQYMDGINLDIEQVISRSSPEHNALTSLVKETADAFHREIQGSQVTFDFNWTPKYTGRRYNYFEIANACDFVFVMSYDEHSLIWADCIAGSNAPYVDTLAAYDDYIKMGINPKKLVMGVPWYGYDYTCLTLSEADVCTTAKVSYKKGPCLGAKSHQVTYKTIMKQVNNSISGIRWNKDQQAPYYNYKVRISTSYKHLFY